MSNTAVENEVVRMQFDNRQFEAGVKQSMSTLDKLKAALHLDKSAQGFKQIGDAAKKVNFNPITQGIEGVKKSFTYMDVAFATAVARMTNDAITAGKRIGMALTIDPIKTGLDEYETKLKAIQVMKSNKGGTLDEINRALNELNTYADKTIYNFTQMTSNVGKFVAQGMSAERASKAVMGLANLAGASGASAEDMARATYQMSQAMGGTIRKIDWNSLRNANMATTALKQTLIDVGTVYGKMDVDSIIKAKGTFEDSLEKGWLTGDIFTEAMQIYSDVYSEAELKAKGYTDQQIKNFKQLAAEAKDATTSVKSLSQLWDVVKETAQSGWTQTWELIIGDLDEAKRIFTNLNNMISGYIDKVSNARNEMLSMWASGQDTRGKDSLTEEFTALKTIGKDKWHSLKEANILTEKLKYTLKEIVKTDKTYKVSDGMLAKINKDFKESLSEGWLSGGLFAEAMKIYSNAYSEAELKAKGYTEEQIKAFDNISKAAEKATKTMVDSAGLTGREEFLLGLSEFAHGIVEVIDSIKRAFRDIFPAMTAERLLQLSQGFRKLMQSIKPTYNELANIYYTMRGLFSIIGFVRDVIYEVIKALVPAFKYCRNLTDIILTITGAIGNFIYTVTKMIRESGAIHGVVATISNVLGTILEQIGRIIYQIYRIVHDSGLDLFLVQIIGYLGDGIVFVLDKTVALITKVADIIEKISPKVKAFFMGFAEAIVSGKPIEYLIGCFAELGEAMKKASKSSFFSTAFQNVGKLYTAVANTVSKAVVATYNFAKSLDLSRGLALVLSGIFGILLLNLTGLTKAMTGMLSSFGGLADTISAAVKKIASRNHLILELALFVGVLTASLYTLSKIPFKDLRGGVIAIGALAAIMATFTIVMTKFNSKMQTIQGEAYLYTIAIVMSMATALVFISKAVKTLSSISFGSAIAAILEIGIIMAELAGISILIMKTAPKVSVASIVMLLFCKTLSKATNYLLKIDFNALKGISKNVIATAAILSGAALLLGIGIEKLSFSISRLAFGVILISGAIALLSALKVNFGAIAGTITAILGVIVLIDKISNIVGKFGGASRKISKAGIESKNDASGIKEFSKAIMRVVVSIGMMVLIMKLAEILKPTATSVISLIGIVVLIGGLITLMSVLGKKYATDGESIKAVGRSMIQVASAIAIIATVCVLLSLIAALPGGVSILMTAMGMMVTLSVCVGVLIALSKNGSQVKMGPILALMLGLAAIFTNLAIIAGLGTDQIYAATTAVAAVLATLSGVIFALSKIKPDNVMNNMVIILGVSVLLISFAVSMALLCQYDWADIAVRLVEIIATFTVFEAIILIAAGIAKKCELLTGDMFVAAATIGILAASMLALSVAMNIMPLDWKKFGMFAAILGTMLATFAALGAIGKFAATGITLLAGALLELGAALGLFALTVIVVVAGFAAFIGCLALLSKIDLSSAIGGLLGFAVAMTALVVFAPAIAPATAVLLSFGLALLAINGALLIGSGAILLLSKALTELNKVSGGRLAKVGGALLLLGPALVILGAAGLVAWIAIPTLNGMAESLDTLSKVNITAVAAGMTMLAIAMQSLVPSFLTLLGSSLGLKLFTEEMTKLEPALINCATAIQILVSDMQQFINMKDAFVQAANYVGQGLSKGLSDGIKSSQNVMSACANNLIGTYRSELGIASPSKVFEQLGYYTMQGLIIGITENDNKTVEAMKTITKQLADTVSSNVDSMKTAGKNAGDALIDEILKTFDSKKNKAEDKGKETGEKAGVGVKNAFLSYAANIIETAGAIGHNAGATFANEMMTQVSNGVGQIDAYIAGIKAQYKDFKENGKYDTLTGNVFDKTTNIITNAAMTQLEAVAKNKNMSVDEFLNSDEYKQFVAEQQILNDQLDRANKAVKKSLGVKNAVSIRSTDDYIKQAYSKYAMDNGIIPDMSWKSMLALQNWKNNGITDTERKEVEKVAAKLEEDARNSTLKVFEDKAKSYNMNLYDYYNSNYYAADLKKEAWNKKSAIEKLYKSVTNGFNVSELNGDALKQQVSKYTGGFLNTDEFMKQYNSSFDYGSKAKTQTRVTQEEFKMLEDMGNIKTHVMKESVRRSNLATTQSAFWTEQEMKNRGWEYDASTKTWRKYYAINEKGEETTQIIKDETSAMNGLSDATEKLGKTSEETETEMEAFTKALNSNLKSAMNYFDEFKYGTEEDKVTKEELLKNLEDQHNGMINWAKDMEKLAQRGMSKDLWKNLAEEGPASYAKVKAFLDMTQAELQQANTWFARDLALPDVTTDFMSSILGGIYGSDETLNIAKNYGEDIGKNNVAGMAEGVLGSATMYTDGVETVLTEGHTVGQSVDNQHSPSKWWRQFGEYNILGLCEGIKNTSKLYYRSLTDMCKNSHKLVKRGLEPKLFKSIGVNAMQGLMDGFISQIKALDNLIDSIADRIPHTITGKWVIKSPSRLFKSFGMYAMEGLALGLSQYSTLAEAAASETADNTAKTLNGITNSVLDWDTDFNPVITPTLNLDNVTRGVREINDMFKETTLDTVVEDPVQNGGTTTQPSTTFIQNNYSPKHLSSIDIYRQTRNQLSSLKGAMG